MVQKRKFGAGKQVITSPVSAKMANGRFEAK
jgi:hypothetical protein